jgi:hypothetical protein
MMTKFIDCVDFRMATCNLVTADEGQVAQERAMVVAVQTETFRTADLSRSDRDAAEGLNWLRAAPTAGLGSGFFDPVEDRVAGDAPSLCLFLKSLAVESPNLARSPQ